MKRHRGGFRLGRRLVRIWRCVFRLGRRCCPKGGNLLPTDPTRTPAAAAAISHPRGRIETSAVTTRLFHWGRSLSRSLRLGPRRLGDRAPLLEEEGEGLGGRPPPKGHLAVYVGGGRRDAGEQPPRRYVVPVIYFNHPLFGELLREAEEEFGFQHPGGITIPCPAAKFEHVRTRIASGSLHLRRKSSSRSILL